MQIQLSWQRVSNCYDTLTKSLVEDYYDVVLTQTYVDIGFLNIKVNPQKSDMLTLTI